MKKFFIMLVALCVAGSTMASSQNKTDKHGRKQGAWSKTYKNGTVQYEGQFKDDVPFGTFKRYYESGKLQSVQVYDANNTSDVTFYEVDGKTVATLGHFDGKSKVGEWQYFSNGELVLTEVYMNGVRHGVAKTYNKGKLMEETPYANGQIDGVVKSYMENGKLYSTVTYKNGEMNGEYKLYEGNDNPVQTGQYLNGKKSGVWESFDEKGQKLESETFLNGIPADKKELKKQIRIDRTENKKAAAAKHDLPEGVNPSEVKMVP